jgi:D-3-phosphoglycerate dehydrogenase
VSDPFRVGLSRDFLGPDGKIGYGDIGLGLLEAAPGVRWDMMEGDAAELRPEHVRDYDALLLLGRRVTAATLEGVERLAVIARFGVGYDNVDVEACARRGVLVTITPDGVRRPVAATVLTLVLALAHKLFVKDRLVRAGRWGEKLAHMGTGLTGRTLGLIGLGNIGREVVSLFRPLEMRVLAADPQVSAAQAAASGAEPTDLETLFRESDFVAVCCALTPQTRGLVSRERLALMKPTAYLVNVARGPIVDQRALTDALRTRRIAGAGLDVFEEEPTRPDDPLLGLDNVILSPHALCWTDECFRGIGRSACTSILDVAAGRAPAHVVSRAALEHPGLIEKLRRYDARGNP